MRKKKQRLEAVPAGGVHARSAELHGGLGPRQRLTSENETPQTCAMRTTQKST
jgi:hypothetical protein